MMIRRVLRPTRIEWISFLILMPIISLVTSLLLYGSEVFQSALHLSGSFLAVYLIGLISWYLHVTSMHALAELLPDLRQTVPRLVLLALIHILLISITMVCYFYGFNRVHYLGLPVLMDNFKSGIWVGIFLTMIATTLWQVEFIFKKWKISLSDKELVEQQRLVLEFDNLKKQINPHFLFNNLNVLSSLISEDPARAEYFLNELSKVYRYLLKNSEEELTTLEKELKFIESYFALLKIRHNEAILLSVQINDEYKQLQLPAFALQLLVENAVKHNVATKSKPLFIEMNTTADGNLIIKNNLQKKNSRILSNHVGLANIAENYRLLLGRQLQIEQDEKEFKVILPLIPN